MLNWGRILGTSTFIVHKFGSSPELAPRHDPASISAPQPRRPICLSSLSSLSSLCRAKCPSDQAAHMPSTMMPWPRLISTDPTTLYPSHVLSPLEPTHEPESSHGRVLSCPFLLVFLTLNSSIKSALEDHPHCRIDPTQIAC